MLKEIFHKKLFINDKFVKYESRLKLVITWFCYHESLYKETPFLLFCILLAIMLTKIRGCKYFVEGDIFQILLTLNSFCMEVVT